MLIQIPQVLNAEQVRRIRGTLTAAESAWVDGRATAGHQGMPVKRNQQIAEDSNVAHELGDIVLAALERNPLFISAALPNRVYPPMFNRYGENMQFGNHVDGAVRLIPGTGIKFRTDISATLFLTEPDSYDGGELMVEDTYGTHAVKLNAGDMILYPASSVHQVTPITRGRTAGLFFSGYKAWCATMRNARCYSIWTGPSSTWSNGGRLCGTHTAYRLLSQPVTHVD